MRPVDFVFAVCVAAVIALLAGWQAGLAMGCAVLVGTAIRQLGIAIRHRKQHRQ